MKLFGDSTDINKVFCNPVVPKKLVKLLKLAIFGPKFHKKGFSMNHAHKEKQIFLAEITKADYQLSETFCFIKISYALTEL